MKAFVITGPRECSVTDVPPPIAAPGQVVVDVQRAGVCGTDVEFYTGDMEYLHNGQSRYPVRIGHEWCGIVSTVGAGVDADLVGRRVTGDTMLGCGQCRRCRTGRQHVCANRHEIGILGWPGALAEQLAVPATALHVLPSTVDEMRGAMVEPGGNALRCVQAAALSAGERLLVVGPGTIGLLAALFALAQHVEVHVLGTTEESLAFARTLGVHGAWTESDLPDLPFDAVIDASTGAGIPARAVHLVEPGKRVVYIGLSTTPSLVDSRTLALKDVTAVGILSASPGLAGTIEHYATGAVDPGRLIAATVALTDVGDILAGIRPATAGPGPKIHVDPRL